MLLKVLRSQNIIDYTTLRPFLTNSDRYRRRSSTDSKDLICNQKDDADEMQLCIVKRSLDHAIIKLLGKPPNPDNFKM